MLPDLYHLGSDYNLRLLQKNHLKVGGSTENGMIEIRNVEILPGKIAQVSEGSIEYRLIIFQRLVIINES